MCGIFGFHLNRRLSDIDVKNGKKYLDLLSHRGPDNTGFFVQKDIGLFIERFSLQFFSRWEGQIIRNKGFPVVSGVPR